MIGAPTSRRRLWKARRTDETNKNNLTVSDASWDWDGGYLYRFEFKDGWDSSIDDKHDYGVRRTYAWLCSTFRHPGTHSTVAINGAQWNDTLGNWSSRSCECIARWFRNFEVIFNPIETFFHKCNFKQLFSISYSYMSCVRRNYHLNLVKQN